MGLKAQLTLPFLFGTENNHATRTHTYTTMCKLSCYNVSIADKLLASYAMCVFMHVSGKVNISKLDLYTFYKLLTVALKYLP